MIKNTAISSVTPLAEKLTRAKVVLEPLPGTPLDLLNQQCSSAVNDVAYAPTPVGSVTRVLPVDEVSVVDVGNAIQKASMEEDAGGNHPHDEAMDAYIEAATKTFNDNNNIARTVVNPVVNSAYEKTQKLIEETVSSAISPLSILPVKLPSVFSTPALLSFVDNYKQTPVEDASIQRWFPDLNDEETLGLVATGSGAFDASVKEALDVIGLDTIKTVYQNLFSTPVHEIPLAKISDYLNIQTDVNVVLVAFLLARTLKGNIPDGVRGPNKLEYDTYLGIIQAQSGRLINRILERRQSSVQNRTVVLEYPILGYSSITKPEEGVITVNADLYNEWLEAGGSPEVIFGAFVSGAYRRDGRNFNSLLENAEVYKASWTRQFNLMVANQSAQKFNNTIQAISLAVSQEIVSLSDENVVVQSRGEYQDRLREQIAQLTRKDIEDLYATVRRVVCRSMFAHTDAEFILVTIDDYMKQNDKLDVREAALLANIDLYVDWSLKLANVRTFQ